MPNICFHDLGIVYICMYVYVCVYTFSDIKILG